MTIEQITQLKGLGYTAEEIAMLAPSITDPGMPAAAAPDPAPAPEQESPADKNNAAVLDAIAKLTETIQANNRAQQGTGAAPVMDTSTIFDTIINGISKKG